MSLLTEDYIKKLATSETTFIKGLKLYKTDSVLEVKKIDPYRKDSNDLYFKARVLGTSRVYELNIKLKETGEQISASCDCPAYYTSIGNCKHITASLLHIKEHHFNDSQIKEDLNQLVELYKRKKTLNINLTPGFVIDNNNVGIELRVGNEHTYVVKNIKYLFELIKSNSFFQYGQSLGFNHSIDAFNVKSRKLLRYIEEDATSRENSTYYMTFDNKRVLQLGELNFEQILELYENEELSIKIDGEVYLFKFTKMAPPLEFTFYDNRLAIKEFDKCLLIKLKTTSYLLKNNILYSFKNLKNNDLYPLFKQLLTNTYIKIDDSNSGLFFTYIWPKIKNDIVIDNKEDLVALNKLKELTAKIYLDLKDNILFLKYTFYYGDLDKDTAVLQGEFINELAENDFLEYIYELGFDRVNLSIEDDDKIYQFLTTDIEDLKSKAEVYISDSIKNLSIKQMKQPSIGVKFDNNLLEVSIDNLDFDISELEKVLKTYQLKKKYYRSKDGSVIDLNGTYVDILNQTVDSLNIPAKKVKEVNEVEIYKAMKLENILDSIKDNFPLRQFISDLKNYNKQNYTLSNNFAQTLRDYQKTGYKWLKNLTKYKLGGILADDMGLGKTLQIITLIASDDVALPSLIVAPASLIYNWQNEFTKFASDVNVIVIEGNASEREKIIKSHDEYKVLITSYDYLKRDIDLYEGLKFRFIVVDEAQNIKNFNTKNALSVKSIDAEVRFALTGTPIENTLADLWSIFDYILPGYFKTYQTFKTDYEVEIVKNENKDMLTRLTRQISPFILRRTKKDVLSELPPKVEQIIYAKMDEEQSKVYQALLLNIKRKLHDPDTNKFMVLSYLTRLRQICCDPHLIYDSYIGASPKLDLTIDLIKESIAARHKILVFSQFTSMLDIIARRLNEDKINFLTLTGDTPTKTRPALVEQFNNDDNVSVFLISLKAGGLGLNLTGADTIIHYDPWWNISAENQASDRAHRIGQTKTVQVMKIIMKDSVEEKILKLQDRKKELINQVINDDDQLISKLSFAEIVSLFD